MNEKIKKFIKLLLKNWRTIAEFFVVAWAIKGISNIVFIPAYLLNMEGVLTSGDSSDFLLGAILFYFLSAVLILYLLRKH